MNSEVFGAKRGCGPPPPKRQSQADLQATMLARMEGFAGRLAALEVSGAAPIPTPCSSGLAMLGMHAASAKVGEPSTARSSHSAWSRCRHQSHPTQGKTGLRSPIKKQRRQSSPSRPRRGTHKVQLQFWTCPEAHARWRRSS